MGVPDLQRHRVSLEALFPGVVLPCMYDPATGRIWFPIATTCALLDLDPRSQRMRAQRDYAEYVEKFRLPTDGGPQELLCIEYEALALWISSAQEGKATPAAQARLRRFKMLVMAGASDILMGRSTPVPMEERRKGIRAGGQRALLQEHDTRLGTLERAVFVGDPEEDTQDTIRRSVSCPECGHSFPVKVRSIDFIVERE
jgi:hypothetical protein